ncbi:ankyrin repeat-containing domain protein [Aspergillus crustosus]
MAPSRYFICFIHLRSKSLSAGSGHSPSSKARWHESTWSGSIWKEIPTSSRAAYPSMKIIKRCIEISLNGSLSTTQQDYEQLKKPSATGTAEWFSISCNRQAPTPGCSSSGHHTPPLLNLAAEQGDAVIMNMILNQDKNVHGPHGTMTGLLEIALNEKHYKIVDLLMARGADTHEISLNAAVRIREGIDLVKSLLQMGRRDFSNPLYGTVLQKACVEGDIEIVQLLLEDDHAINPKSPMVRSGNSPLMGAIVGGHVKVVKLLLSKGASVAAAESALGNAIKTAVSLWGCSDLVQLLLDHFPLFDEPENGRVPCSRLDQHSLDRPNEAEHWVYSSMCSLIRRR